MEPDEYNDSEPRLTNVVRVVSVWIKKMSVEALTSDLKVCPTNNIKLLLRYRVRFQRSRSEREFRCAAQSSYGVHCTVSTKLRLQNTYCDIKLGACAVLLAACRAGALMWNITLGVTWNNHNRFTLSYSQSDDWEGATLWNKLNILFGTRTQGSVFQESFWEA